MYTIGDFLGFLAMNEINNDASLTDTLNEFYDAMNELGSNTDDLLANWDKDIK